MSLILLVEDDPNLGALTLDLLKREGYVAVLAPTLAEARTAMRQVGFSLLVLDWMLPDGQGIDLLKELRLSRNSIPVILLTARTELVDKVVGLETGANDYLTKPFEPRELIARIRVQLRPPAAPIAAAAAPAAPSTPSAETPLRVGTIELLISAREARSWGAVVAMTKMEFDLLKLFCENPGRVFTREELLNQVWGHEKFPTTRTVDTHMLQLRGKFGEAQFETVRGVGYRMKI